MNTCTAQRRQEDSRGARILYLNPSTRTKKTAALTRSGCKEAKRKLCTRVAMKSMRLRTAHRTFAVKASLEGWLLILGWLGGLRCLRTFLLGLAHTQNLHQISVA